MFPFKTNLNFQMKLSADDLILVYVLAILFILFVLGLLCFFLDRCDRYATKVSASVAGKLEKPLFGHSVYPVFDGIITRPRVDDDEYSIV